MNGTKSRSTRIRRTDHEARRTTKEAGKAKAFVHYLCMCMHVHIKARTWCVHSCRQAVLAGQQASHPTGSKQATTTTRWLCRDAQWLPQLLLRTNKLVGDEFRMLDVSTTNCSDVVSNYSSEIPSNSAAAINNAATNQGSYIYTMRSGKTRSWELFYSDKSRNNLVWSKKNADEVRQEPRQAQK